MNDNDSQTDAWGKLGKDSLKALNALAHFVILDDVDELKNSHEPAWKRGIAAANILLDFVGPEARCVKLIAEKLGAAVIKAEIPVASKALEEMIQKGEYKKIGRFFSTHTDELSNGVKEALEPLLKIPEVKSLLHNAEKVAEPLHDIFVRSSIIPSLKVSEYARLDLKRSAAAATGIHYALKGLRDGGGDQAIAIYNKAVQDIQGVVMELAKIPHPAQQRYSEHARESFPIWQSKDDGQSWSKIPNGHTLTGKIESVSADTVKLHTSHGKVLLEQTNLEVNGFHPNDHIGQTFTFSNDTLGNPHIKQIVPQQQRESVHVLARENTHKRQSQGFDYSF